LGAETAPLLNKKNGGIEAVRRYENRPGSSALSTNPDLLTRAAFARFGAPQFIVALPYREFIPDFSAGRERRFPPPFPLPADKINEQ